MSKQRKFRRKRTHALLLAMITAQAAWAEDGESTASQPQTVVITGQRNPDRVGKTTLQGEELRQVPGSAGDPLRALQSLPGVTVSDDGSAAPAIRGSRPQDNAYYVDGLPVGYLFHAGDTVSVIHADLVRRFDLYSAAFGPQYADVTGAVLDVALRNPRQDRIAETINVGFTGAEFLVEGPLSERQSFYFAGRRSFFDLLVKSVKNNDNGTTIEVPRYSDYQGKYLWRLNDRNTVTVHLDGAADHLAMDVPADSVVAVQQPKLAGSTSFDTSYDTQAVSWDSDVDTDTGNTVAIGHTRSQDRTVVGAAGNVTTDANVDFLREQFRFKPAAAHDVLLGGEYSAARVDLNLDIIDPLCTEFNPQCDLTTLPHRQLAEPLRVNAGAFFAKDRWQVLEPLTLVGGLRRSHEDYLHRSYTEPRFGAEWTLTPTTLITAGWGRYNQFPAWPQVLPVFGNPNLTHIRADHSVLGLTRTLADGWSWKTEIYYKKFDGFVVDDNLNYVNGGSGNARGLELLLRKEATSRFYGWFSLSLANSRRRNDRTGVDFPFEFDQPVIANLVGNYRISDEWLLGAKWTFHSGNLDTPILGTSVTPPLADGRPRPLYGAIDSERMPAYHRLDLRLERKVSPSFKWYLDLINAYNHKNVAAYQYTADYTQRKPIYQLPWLPSAGIEAKF
jgi:hypothetical protein